MDKHGSDQRMMAFFGFKPAFTTTARPLEVVIIQRTLEGLARSWKQAHDLITDLRAEYQKNSPIISAEKALKDRDDIVKLEQKRDQAFNAWADAYTAAKQAGCYEMGRSDIAYWAKPAATVA